MVDLTGMPLYRPKLTRSSWLRPAIAFSILSFASVTSWAAEHVTLRNGFDLTCDHRVPSGDTERLYLSPAETNYIDVRAADIVSVEPAPGTPSTVAATTPIAPAASPANEVLSPSELHEVLQGAGYAHDLDIDLLASVVHAESSSHVHARSRAGAEGLMQLMPGTAAALGIHNTYAPQENVGGGAAYLDELLRRYHDNLAFALAAYNAGPAAVDRWHGIPPYRETHAYVARIIHEFNQRYAARRTASATALASIAAPMTAAKR